MASKDLRVSHKIITMSDFASSVNLFTLKFKNKNLENEYPKKSISPFKGVILLKILLYLSLAFIALKRLKLLIFSCIGHPMAIGTITDEAINFSLLVGAAVLEAIVFFIKPLRSIRGFFIMTSIYFSTSFTSYYIDKTTLFGGSA